MKENKGFSLNAAVSVDVGDGTSLATSDSAKIREHLSRTLERTIESYNNSNQRRMEVSVSSESHQTAREGSETVTVLKFKNLNAGRTENFYFVRINQEYHCLLRLTGLTIGAFSKEKKAMIEYPIHDLGRVVTESVLNEKFTVGEGEQTDPEKDKQTGTDDSGQAETRRDEPVSYQTEEILKDLILEAYGEVKNYRGKNLEFIEEDDDGVLRMVWSGLSYDDRAYQISQDRGTTIHPEGVIISAKRVIRGTDCSIMDVELGKRTALDEYGQLRQDEEVRNTRIPNDVKQMGLDLVGQLEAQGKLTEAIELYRDLFGQTNKPEQQNNE
jgi:hypothetical protein